MDAGLYKSIVWVHALLGVLAKQGIEASALLNGTDVQASLLADGRARVTLSQWRTLVRRTIELADDPGLGLTIGATAPDSMYQLVVPIVSACRTMREAMQLFDRYRPLMGNMNRFELVEEGERAYLTFSPLCPDPELAHFDAELGLSLVYRVPRRFAKRDSDDADEIWFSHAEPAHAARYAEVFRCPVRFGKPRNAILFSRHYLDEEQIYANPVLLDTLRETGERLLTQQGSPSLPERVRALLSHQRDLHRVNADAIAKQLKLNPRSFRRQLSEAGTSWTMLLDDARCQIACNELRRGITIQELTERLGFSEPSAFNRAFKRWTGKTPAKYGRGERLSSAPSLNGAGQPR